MRVSPWILAFCALAAGMASGAVVPDGKAAVAEMVIGKVDLIKAAGDTSALAQGQALDFGDRIASGIDGRVALRLANRSSARLAPNSEMSFKDPAQRKGTFIGLVKGWARFLVGSRLPGEAFEVSTDNAVAAVKGTDLEVGIEDNGSTYACVYSSEHHPALNFGDPNGTNGINLDAGQGATFDGLKFNQFQDLGPNGQPNGDRYHGLPTPGPTGDQSDANPNPNPSPNPSPVVQGNGDKLGDAIQGAVNQLNQDLQASGNQDNQDRNSDLASGRVGIDRFGYPVRMSNNLIRTAPDTVVLSTLSERTAGPNQGVTSASLTTQFNQVLPTDWLDVLKLSLTSPSNMDSKGSPIWWQIQNVFTAANPGGDNLVLTTLYSAPYLNVNAALTQDYIQDLWAYTPQVGLPSLRSAASVAPIELSDHLYYEVVSSNPNAATGILATDAALLANPTAGGSASPRGSFTEVTTQLAGGINLSFVDNFTGTQSSIISSSFSQTFHILDGQGNLQPLPGSVQSQLDAKTFGGIDALNFIGVDRSLNIETGFDVSGFFKKPIDLLVMPEIFDGFGGVLPIFSQPLCNSCG
jgi:hypothetical protein